jgi:amidophosphoribosyltransferase
MQKAQENLVILKLSMPFEPQEVSDKIAEMLSSPEIKAEVKIIFQTVEDLHASQKFRRLVFYGRLNYTRR